MDTDQHPGGAARLLVGLYALFALAAGARALYQIVSRWERAPLAYGLSALAALVYLIACVALARPGRLAWRAALAACAAELAGVLGVGAASVLAPQLFADASVWSGFGAGYAYVPLALPVLGLAYLLRADTRRACGVGR